MNMLWSLLTNFGGWIAGGIALLAGFVAVKNMGRAQVELKQVQANERDADKAAKVRRDVRDLGVAGRRIRLRDKYTRPD